MTNQRADGASQSFSMAFFGALGGALTEASGSAWQITVVPDAVATTDETEPVRVKLTLDGSLRGAFLLEFQHSAAVMLTSKYLRQSGDELGTDFSGSLLKLIDAGIGMFRISLAQKYGTFSITACTSLEPASDRAKVNQITIAEGDANRASVLMYLNPALTEALSLHSEAGDSAAGTRNAMEEVEKEVQDQVNLNLVMDVELNVTLRFGQRQLTLREVLELTSGSVVELDRQVEEPVELLLEGKVIARGEAVVIDGNYGLRITEVSRPTLSQALR
jgi:flagellar motor switch protein FliN/FliY